MNPSSLQIDTSTKPVAVNVTPLRVNLAWTITGNTVYAGCQWGMLVALAKLGTPSAVGQFALGLAVVSPIVMFANLQLRTVQATDALGEFAFRDYLSFRLITVVMVLLATAVIACLSQYPPRIMFVMVALALAKSFDALSDIVYGLFQQREKMDLIAKSMLIKGPLSLLAFALVFEISGNVGWSAMVLATVWALVFVLYDFRNGKHVLRAAASHSGSQVRPRLETTKLTRLFKLGLPLGLVMLLISLNANVPRYFIQHYLGERELGIFASLAYLPAAATLVVEAAGQSATARLSRYFALGLFHAYRKLTLQLIALGAVLGTCGMAVAFLVGERLLTILYGSEYGRHVHILLWLMLAGGLAFISSFLGYAITAARYFYAPIPMLLLTLSGSALGCLFLVPAHGLIGATFAVTIAAAVQLVTYAVVLMNVFKAGRKIDHGV